MRKALIGLTAAVMFTAGAAHAEKYNLTLSGASPGGLWSRIGGGIDAALAKAYPGSTVTYQTSSGGLANVPLVATGKVPLGMATDGELTVAYTGKAPFKAPVKSVRVLFRTYTPDSRFQMTHIVLNKSFADKYGIKTFADIVAKKAPVRVAINRRGNMDGDVSEMIMDVMGATEKDIEGWGGQVVRAASKEIVSLMLDRRIDLANYGVSFNHPSVQEIARGVEPVLLDIPASVAEKVATAYGGGTCPIKPGEYKWSAGGANSVCMGSVIVVNETMANELAYNLAKGMVDQIEEFKAKSHRLIAATVTPQVMAGKAIAPFHPGAEKYFREAGILK